jgi:predicted nucleic acid-binding Zn ribbon protein
MRKRHYARQPKKAADIVAQLFARKGYGATQTSDAMRDAWSAAAGPALSRFSRAGTLRRGKLEVTVANSMMMQELGFERRRLLTAMQQAMPDARIEEIRFRVGRIDS